MKMRKSFFALCPRRKLLERDGKRFLLCHAIPSDPLFGYCPEDSERWQQEVETIQADYLLVGHTHTPFIKTSGANNRGQPRQPGATEDRQARCLLCGMARRAFRTETISLMTVERTLERIRRMPVPADIQRDLATVLRTGSV